MKRTSWIALGLCLIIAAGLGYAFLLSQSGSEHLTEHEAIDMTQKMEHAFSAKNANGVLAYVGPASDTRIMNITPDQLHLLLVRYFRSADRLSADLTNYAFAGGDTDATLQFDIAVHNDGMDSRKTDYSGHITLHLRRVQVPHLMNLYQTKEWRIVGADSTGPDLTTFGD